MSSTETDNLKAGVMLLGKRLAMDVRLVRQRCLVDPTFRALCEDYFLAFESRRRLQRIDVQSSAPVLNEYEAVLAELEAEATAALLARRGEF